MFGLNEALMSFVRRQVGLRTDGADANGSLHAKVKDSKNHITNYISDYVEHKGVVASNNVRISADKEYTFSANNALGKIKEIQIFMSGTVRVSFDLIRTGGGSYDLAKAVIKLDDKEWQERTESDTYRTFTRDINVEKGDVIELHIVESEASGKCRNFRIAFDYRTTEAIVLKN
ncbi:MAG TPA: hypothetical protein VFD57_06490 [Clostridia bacterium]|nr:hypothetical protein [Clostridia bacterium]